MCFQPRVKDESQTNARPMGIVESEKVFTGRLSVMLAEVPSFAKLWPFPRGR